MKKLAKIVLALLAGAMTIASCSSDDDYAVEKEKNPQDALLGQKLGKTFLYGHEYVDLGLSVKWATCNVGATSPEGYGDYFAWGETTPKDSYTWSNLKYCTSYDAENMKYAFSKYVKSSTGGTVENKTILDLSDDAANANWGGTWRMPTTAEQTELLNNCYWEWTTDYNKTGVTGYIVYKVKSDSDKGKHPYYDNGFFAPAPTASYSLNDNHIFLPAAGFRYDSILSRAESYGCYWSLSLSEDSSIDACGLYFGSNGVGKGVNYRYYGHSVRAVLSE